MANPIPIKNNLDDLIRLIGTELIDIGPSLWGTYRDRLRQFHETGRQIHFNRAGTALLVLKRLVDKGYFDERLIRLFRDDSIVGGFGGISYFNETDEGVIPYVIKEMNPADVEQAR